MRTAALTASIRRQGFSLIRRFIRHPRQQLIRCKLSHGERVGRNARLFRMSSFPMLSQPSQRVGAKRRPMTGSARAGPITIGGSVVKAWAATALPTDIWGYGSLRSQGRRYDHENYRINRLKSAFLA